ncbi:MAG: LLM class flavin-dependent oxidoreductase [Actinomycetota bacterium]|nr:LLM class flavin-dependent oxidoreductase [Actinomycetota bacterium]MED5362132.1 LLM class flavin-dependent oxidoreductase [Actinomycetota bacterium]
MLNCWAPIGSGDASTIASRSKQLEQRGYTGVIGNQVYGPPWASLAVAAASTTSLKLETGIAMAFVRSPFETACAALELDRISNGRFTLGLGTAPQTWTENFFGHDFRPPIARTREVIEILRLVFDAAVSGSSSIPDYLGKHYQLSFEALHPNFGPNVKAVPIWVASLREKLCELAGECADGFIGHSIWSRWWLEERALPALHRGISRAGRESDDLDVQLWLTASIDPDQTVAARRSRGNVAFYASIPSYRSYFEAHGFGDLFDTLVEARRSVPLNQCIDLVPLDAARTFAICGTADEVGQEIEEIAGHATSICVKPPMWGIDPEDAIEQARQIDSLLLG